MIRKLIFLFVIVAASAYPQNVQRIVGGTETTIEQHPDMVAMLFSWGTTGHTQACGGTIINNRAILTAAHCTYGDAPARWRSRVGSTFRNTGGVIYDTAAIINHDQYDTSNLNNDVSIIRTASNIAFSNTVRAGIFAGANYHVADNQEVWVSGWGTLYSNGPSSDQLRHVQVWAINQATCRQRYAERGNEVTDNMLCTGWLDVGGRDACQGDSGGPVYHNGVVIGVTSWGAGCASGQFPGVNARVQRYPYWINQNA